MIFRYVFLFLIQSVCCNTATTNTTASYFKKCSLHDQSNKTLSCVLKPFIERKASSYVECAKNCASVGAGQNKTFENFLTSQRYAFNYTKNGINISYGDFSLSLSHHPGHRVVVGDIQVCLGFNYHESNQNCQLFEKPCPAANLTLYLNNSLGVYYQMVFQSNTTCFFGEIEDCNDIPSSGPEDSGVYWMTMDNLIYPVYCEFSSNNTKYMVFQHRFDGSVDFYRRWVEFVNGFGKIDGEYWLGNYLLYRLTNRRKYKLRVEIGAADGGRAYAEYLNFNIGPPTSNYQLAISGYSGTAGDSLAYSNGMQFTTLDRDNDLYAGNCAVFLCGAWWHKGCTYSNLNSIYNLTNPSQCGYGVAWSGFRLHEQLKNCILLLSRA